MLECYQFFSESEMSMTPKELFSQMHVYVVGGACGTHVRTRAHTHIHIHSFCHIIRKEVKESIKQKRSSARPKKKILSAPQFKDSSKGVRR